MYQKDLFKNKHVLVTGGRSGIGYAIAKQFLQLGASVTIASRKKDPLEKAVIELSAFGECNGYSCDIRNVEDIEILANHIKSEYRKLDILINNAGGQFPAPAELISTNGWSAVINNNLNGTFFVSQQMAKTFFIPQRNGTIVNITANIFRGFPGMAHTGAARAGVENLTKTLSQEWAEYNIRINAIAPGTIASSGLDTYPAPLKKFFTQAQEELQAYLTPLGHTFTLDTARDTFTHLTQLAREFQQHTDRNQVLVNELSVTVSKKEAAQIALERHQAGLTKTKEELAKLVHQVAKLQEQRAELLQGQSINEARKELEESLRLAETA